MGASVGRLRPSNGFIWFHSVSVFGIAQRAVFVTLHRRFSMGIATLERSQAPARQGHFVVTAELPEIQTVTVWTPCYVLMNILHIITDAQCWINLLQQKSWENPLCTQTTEEKTGGRMRKYGYFMRSSYANIWKSEWLDCIFAKDLIGRPAIKAFNILIFGAALLLFCLSIESYITQCISNLVELSTDWKVNLLNNRFLSSSIPKVLMFGCPWLKELKYGHIHTFCGHTLTNLSMWCSMDTNISMRLYEYHIREMYFYKRLLILKSIYYFYHTDFYKSLTT